MPSPGDRAPAPRPGALAAAGQPSPKAWSYRQDAAVPGFPDDRPLIVFDGVCVLCSRFAKFVIARDSAEQFMFTHAQSHLGGALFRHYGLEPKDFETNLLIEDGYAHGRLEAFAHIAGRFGFPWNLANSALLLPRFLRDWLYERIARNRYSVFGKTDACRIPEGLSGDRFLA